MRLPFVSVAVIPADIRRDAMATIGFWIFDDNAVALETPTAAIKVTRPHEVSQYVAMFGDLHGEAIHGHEARHHRRPAGHPARLDGIIGWMKDCVFCGIVAGRLPSYRVLEDEHTMAFLDIGPASPGHTLVVPRVHTRDLWEISEVAHGQVAGMVHRVAALLKKVLAPDGVNVTHATGEAAWQDVFHFHVHVIPRWRGDDLRPMWDSRPVSPDDLRQVRERVAAGR